MYSDEDKSTAIAYRIIHENLPVFLDNQKTFEKIAESDVAKNFANIEKSFEEYLNVAHLADAFQLDNFTETLTQEQISVYNYLIGGRTMDDGTKLKGINEYVNLYNQEHNNVRLPLLKPLYKMILSDRTSLSWLPEKFSSDEEMLTSIRQAIESLNDTLVGNDAGSLKNLLENIDIYNTGQIYIANDSGLTNISQHMFGQYDIYIKAKKAKLLSSLQNTVKNKCNPEKEEKRVAKHLKSIKSFSIDELNTLAEDKKIKIQEYYSKLGAYDRDGIQRDNILIQIEKCREAAEEILAGKHLSLNQDEDAIKIIKDLLDSYKSLQYFIKPLLGNGDEPDKDNEFYAHLLNVWNNLGIITPLYDKVRNWLTRKPYSEEKIKLNFENKGDLLGGWVDSRTERSDNGTQYGGYIFRKTLIPQPVRFENIQKA